MSGCIVVEVEGEGGRSEYLGIPHSTSSVGKKETVYPTESQTPQLFPKNEERKMSENLETSKTLREMFVGVRVESIEEIDTT